MYLSGQGVPQNTAEAIRWYRLAAEQGYAIAQHNLGSIFASGHGAPQNFAEAAKWFRLAADQGYAAAQVSLGALYEDGQGVAQDYVLAHMWYNLAASLQPASESQLRNLIVSYRDELSKKNACADCRSAEAR